jgi:hypothetical protein
VSTTSQPSLVLMAVSPTLQPRVERLLEGRRYVRVATVEEAQNALATERFSLLAVDVHFHDSRMFDVMTHARASALNRETPIVSMLGDAGRLSQVTLRMLAETVNSMWATQFLNLADFPDDATPRQRLAALLRSEA